MYSFKEMPPSQLFPGSIPCMDINTGYSVVIGSTLKNTNLPFGCVSASVIPSRPRWSRTSNPFVWLSPREKKWDPTNYFLYGVFDLGWYEFQLKYWWLWFVFCKIQVPDPAWKDLWCHQHGHISCCNHWKIREKKFLYSVFTFFLVIIMILGLLKCLEETSFYERKK